MASRWIQWSWRPRDAHRATATLAVTGLAIAVGMALFGLPPIDFHGPLHRFGIMDPLCGGTRAARYTAMGKWGLAWRYNPLGIVAVVGAAATIVRTVVGLAFSRWLTVTLMWTTSRRRIAIATALLALVALTTRQQLRADLLMAGT